MRRVYIDPKLRRLNKKIKDKEMEDRIKKFKRELEEKKRSEKIQKSTEE
jgi:hypothetical protein|tara:strand:+ start:206 stop:352 length:147 start_codon:yes stop_codon:yes gene_type:complete